MKHTNPLVFTFSFVARLPLHAANTQPVPWQRLCQAAQERELRVATSSGETVEGYCLSIDVNEVSLSTQPDRKVVKVARTAIAHMEAWRPKRHNFRTLMADARSGIKHGASDLLTPAAVAGMVEISAVVAWAAVSSPFCLLGDLVELDQPTQEIRVQ